MARRNGADHETVGGIRKAKLQESFSDEDAKRAENAGSPKALLARRNISSEALRVNVRSMIRTGSIPCDTSQGTRAARVLVLPVPAPAMARTGPSPIVAARSCSGFRSSIRDSGIVPSRIRAHHATSSH